MNQPRIENAASPARAKQADKWSGRGFIRFGAFLNPQLPVAAMS